MKKTGLVSITKLTEHICRLVTKYSSAMLAAITNAETANIITSSQADTARAFLTAAQAACTVFKLITGY